MARGEITLAINDARMHPGGTAGGEPARARSIRHLRAVAGGDHRRRRGVARLVHQHPLGPPLLLLDAGTFTVAVLAVGRWHLAYLVLGMALVTIYAAGGLYRTRLSLSALDDLPSLLGRALVAAAVVTTVGVLGDGDAATSLLYTAVLFAALSLVVRAAGYAFVRRVRRAGALTHRTLIIGADEVGRQLAEMLKEHPEYGLRPAGFVDDHPRLPDAERPVPLIATSAELAKTIVAQRISQVIVAFCAQPASSMVETLRTCDRLRCEILLVPRLYELSALSRDMDSVWGLPLVRLRRAPFRSASWRLKRVVDAVLAGAALVALAPVLLVCAVLVRLDDGPVLFRQERVGLDGRSFQLLKFRTLTPRDDTESAQNWNVGHDDRLRPVGSFLRRTSLDELPQLWNILRGEMSLVGPRPERPFFVHQFTREFPRYMARCRVPAGLTGWAQVHGLRGDTSIADRARFDNHYVENWSLWVDVKIIIRTVGQVVRAAGR
jgi:exopolysaccharide biosynthesis polyprenyl glycosylphosphotransferase